MKKRNPKNLFSQEDLEQYINALVNGEQIAFSQPLNSNSWIQPLMHCRSMKVKRKNGRIETHILFSDGSIHDSNIPLTKMKKGDVCLGEE